MATSNMLPTADSNPPPPAEPHTAGAPAPMLASPIAATLATAGESRGYCLVVVPTYNEALNIER